MRNIIVVTLALFIGLSIAGCGKVAKTEDEKTVVAKINNSDLSAADFKEETALIMGNRPLPADTEKAKQELLDIMIARKLLIEEAKKLNFDKDRAFIKEVERYSQQVLFNMMLNTKIKELMPTIFISDEEVRAEYDRRAKEEGAKLEPFEKMAPEIKNYIGNMKMQRALDSWIAGLSSKADVRKYEENLKKIVF